MTTWANTTCNAAGPGGSHCALPAGHAGDHRSETGAMVAKGAKPGTSFARIIVTPLLVLVAGALAGMVVGPMLLWLAGAALIGVVYILVASRR